jgi:hypothetical protein
MAMERKGDETNIKKNRGKALTQPRLLPKMLIFGGIIS